MPNLNRGRGKGLERSAGWWFLLLGPCLAGCGVLVLRGAGAVAEGTDLPVDVADRLEQVRRAGGLTIVVAIFVGASAAAFLLGDQDDATEPAASDQPAADDQ